MPIYNNRKIKQYILYCFAINNNNCIILFCVIVFAIYTYTIHMYISIDIHSFCIKCISYHNLTLPAPALIFSLHIALPSTPLIRKTRRGIWQNGTLKSLRHIYSFVTSTVRVAGAIAIYTAHRTHSSPCFVLWSLILRFAFNALHSRICLCAVHS